MCIQLLVLKILLNHNGVDVNAIYNNEHGYSLLQAMIIQISKCKWLIKKILTFSNLKIDYRNFENDNALAVAMIQGETEIITLLIRRGINIKGWRAYIVECEFLDGKAKAAELAKMLECWRLQFPEWTMFK